MLAIEDELRRNPAWRNRTELLNQCLREAMATTAAEAIERQMIAKQISELKARAEALRLYSTRRMQAADGTQDGEKAFAEAKAALRSIYRRKAG